MKPDEGPLQTAEHILAKILENKFNDIKVIIAEFSEISGRLDTTTTHDLRAISVETLENEINKTISQNLEVRIYNLPREEADKQFNLSRLPKHLKEIRIVDIQNFDKRPCGDPHVSNTKEIGKFKITKIKRVGKDKYRILFEVS